MEGCSWRLSGKSLRNTNHGQWLVLVFPVLFIQLVGRILVRPSTVLNQQLHFYMAIYIFLYIYSCTVYQPIWRHFGCPTSFKFPPFSVKSYHGGWDRPERTWGGTTCSLALQHKMTDFRFFDVFPTDLYTQQAGSKYIDIDMSFRCQNDIFSYGIRSRNESTESWHLKQPVKRKPSNKILRK